MKIAVLLSGGVDSSVALALLKEQYGKNALEAFYLKIWLEDELAYLGNCPWEEDLSYVEAVCKQLDIKLNILSLQKEYFKEVVGYTTQEIKSGRTPNPDVLCNQKVKFGAFLSKIDSSFDFVATGHYAQIERIDNQTLLKCSKDEIKDQTYFLAQLNEKQISRALFPIGHLSKDEVRTLAQKYNLPNMNRKDSQGICFLGKLKFNDFIKAHLGEQKGDLIEFETGKKLGTHNGFWFYTLGQRQGIGLSHGPWYVVSKDTKNNIVYISSNYYSNDKKRDNLIIESCNWLINKPKQDIFNKKLKIKLRHGPKFNYASLTQIDNDKYQIILDHNDQGIAPGQFAVIYDDNICILSGIISN